MRMLVVLALLAACAPAPVPAEPPRSVAARARPAEPPPPPPPGETFVPVEQCGETDDGFEAWLASFRNHAVKGGIAPEVVAALEDVAYDPRVIELDRAQRKQRPTFESFSTSHVTPARVRRGKQQLATHAELLSKLETRFGVAREIVVAIWGLETDFGKNQGTTPSLRALATLAYDCRRAERFRGELTSALRILQRGDLSAGAMVGAWAGEVGQTQFLPSSYERFGIDFDGDGHADLVGSVDDALGSTANYLSGHGWRAKESYQPGSANFTVLDEWNKSEVYKRTIVLFASKLASAGTTKAAGASGR